MFGHRPSKGFEKKGVKYYQTRGDSFFGLDEPITSDQILGKVAEIKRKNVSLRQENPDFDSPASDVRQIPFLLPSGD